MPRKSEEELSKHTLNLYAGDYAQLQQLYPEIGAGVIIRRLVRQYLEQIDAAPSQTPTTPVSI